MDGALEQGHAATLLAERGEDRLVVPNDDGSEVGLGFAVPAVPDSRPNAPKASRGNSLKDWSGREDLNLRPPGPELSQYKLQVL
jgi:hypothetical protein